MILVALDVNNASGYNIPICKQEHALVQGIKRVGENECIVLPLLSTSKLHTMS
jgi:hypothetical protein